MQCQFHHILKHAKCKVYSARFDVRLPGKSKKNDQIYTVLQPDICVVCDREKLYDRRLGAPDIIIEILSKGNSKKELKCKYELYEESGVKEYYVVQPNSESVLIYTLTN